MEAPAGLTFLRGKKKRWRYLRRKGALHPERFGSFQELEALEVLVSFRINFDGFSLVDGLTPI